MIPLLLILVAIVFVFCVVDLWHLKQMLKTMRLMEAHLNKMAIMGIKI